MLEVDYEPEAFPGAKVRLRPLTAALDWQYNVALGANRFTDIQRAFAEVVIECEGAPYFGPGKGTCEKYSRTEVPQLDPDFVFDVVTHAHELAHLTEEELGNSRAPST